MASRTIYAIVAIKVECPDDQAGELDSPENIDYIGRNTQFLYMFDDDVMEITEIRVVEWDHLYAGAPYNWKGVN